MAEGDCDDEDASTYTGAPDTEGDGIDQNCDGVDGIADTDTDTGEGDTDADADADTDADTDADADADADADDAGSKAGGCGCHGLRSTPAFLILVPWLRRRARSPVPPTPTSTSGPPQVPRSGIPSPRR